MKRRELCPYTLRHVARRMRKYQRYYDEKQFSKPTEAAFNGGIIRMAKKAADECIGTAGALERKTKAAKR